MFFHVQIRQTNDDRFDVVVYRCPQAIPSRYGAGHKDAVIVKEMIDVPHLSNAVREAYAYKAKLEAKIEELTK